MKLFDWYKEFGGYEDICDIVYKAKKKDGTIYWVKFNEYNNEDEILDEYDKEMFDTIDLEEITQDRCHAIGEFMCGNMLHGQLLGSMFAELAKCRQDIEHIQKVFQSMNQDM